MQNGSKILIIDDNPIDHMMTRYVLKHNFDIDDVMVLESAEAAISFLDENQLMPNQLPRMIMLDLDMPGLNGFDFMERFANYSDEVKNICKIVVLTWSDVVTDIEKIKSNIYVSQLINKPLCKHTTLNFA